MHQRDQRRQLVFHQERLEKPDQELFIDQIGRWLFRNFDPIQYPDTFILPSIEKIYVVYAHMTDEYLLALDKKMRARERAVAARIVAREEKLGRSEVIYERYEEALNNIVDFYSALKEDHWEAHKAVYLQELIKLLEQVLEHWE